jgi:hypothetical protein
MFSKPLSSASTLDKAIVACVAAMLGFNALVIAQQLQAAPALALTQVEAAASQA